MDDELYCSQFLGVILFADKNKKTPTIVEDPMGKKLLGMVRCFCQVQLGFRRENVRYLLVRCYPFPIFSLRVSVLVFKAIKRSLRTKPFL